MLYIKRNELRNYLKKCRQGWYWFALAFVGCMLLAGAFIFVKNKKYEVYTSLKIKGGSASSSMMATLAKNSGFGDILGMGGTEVDNELTIMQSHHVLYNAVKEIGMNVDYNTRPALKRRIFWKDTPICLTPDSPVFSDTLSDYLKWKVKLSADGKTADIYCKSHEYGTVCDLDDVKLPAHFDTKLGGFTLSTTEYFQPGKSMKIKVGWASYTACAQSLMEDMEFSLINKKADIVQIAYKDVNPNRTIDLLNSVVRNYERYSVDAKNQSTLLSSEMLQNHIDIVAQQLSDLEYQVENYKRSHDLAYPELEAKIAMEQIADLKQQLLELEVQDNHIKMLQQYVNDPAHKFEPLPLIASVGSSSKDKPALAEYNEAILYYQNLKRSAIGNNPALVRAEENIETLRQSVILTLQSMQNSIEKAQKEARKEESKVLSLKSNAPVMEREYVELVRQQELKQKVLLMLQAQQEQNALTINQDTPIGQQVDEAYVNVLPSGPKASVILLIALFFAIFLPMAWLRILDMLCRTIQSPEQLKDLEGFSGDIHIYNPGNQDDLRLIVLALDEMVEEIDQRMVFLTMQGDEEMGTLAKDLENAISEYTTTDLDNELLETPAFTQKADAMYMMRKSDVVLLVVKQGVTLKENLTYIETLLDRQQMQNLLTIYIKEENNE